MNFKISDQVLYDQTQRLNEMSGKFQTFTRWKSSYEKFENPKKNI